ncbi:hypothetical protein POTOM_022361 [Populus tomentosa]|uniref:RRM domain-containing protein n=1 Tax=Populus tomentosa TaxID=118781 RepID=A0A8X7ZRF8_POPTO|nr:hypothetical protein POTOM_062140 [Populus tomentosa]KAG6771016.1 hypothetical protein POTOM_022359 [Populus tomentosa]KAG6771017.1 hypothetical protein POTOM_022360 [Populus tomentosa]KAG6771018.1 hypothetical protein POTOM_022361 [Populus tomentosa]
MSILPSPASQVLATCFKPPPYNPTTQTPANALINPATLNFLQPICYTNNSQNNKHLPKTALTPSVSAKIYFERFPSWLDYQDLKKAFSKISPVTNLFVSRKKTKQGRRFGFVSFFSLLEDTDLCDRLNLVWFDSFKIRANLARFQTPIDSKKKTVHSTKPEIKIPPKLALRDNRTFVEALLVQQPSKKTVMYESTQDDKEWLLRSLVGSIATEVDYAKLEHMVLKTVKKAIGFRFLGASQAVITFTDSETMEKELTNSSSALANYFSSIKPWKREVKAVDRFVWVSIMGLPLIGWNRRCIESMVEDAGKMIGYDITSVSQGSLMGVKVLLCTTSFTTLNKQLSLILDGEKFDISVMEMKPGFSPMLTTIKYSMDTSGTEESDEESCSKITPSEEFPPASINEPEADRTSTEQHDKDMQNDPSLILCTRYTESLNNQDQTDTTYKTFCLFPETKETLKLQTKNQQLHIASHQLSFIEPCYDTIKEKIQVLQGLPRNKPDP